jgi:RNA polymerase sigma-70 factor (ECF subfamily)
VVEGNGLENRQGCKLFVGSNPTLSAKIRQGSPDRFGTFWHDSYPYAVMTRLRRTDRNGGSRTGGAARTPMDTALVTRAQQGDQQAFASIASGIAVRLRKVAYGVLRDMDLAEDAAQQAIVTIWRDLPRLSDPARFEAWSFRVLVRICYAERRRAQNTATMSLDSLSAGPHGPDDIGGVVLRDQLERGFARLSMDHRSVVVLYHQLGLPLAEIAEALDVPVGTVKSRLHRATRELRSALEADLRSTRQVTQPEEVPR